MASDRRRFGSLRRLPSGRWQGRYIGPNGRRYAAPTTFATKTDAARWLTAEEAAIMQGAWLDPQSRRRQTRGVRRCVDHSTNREGSAACDTHARDVRAQPPIMDRAARRADPDRPVDS